MSHDHVLRDPLRLVQGQLLVRRQPHVSVEGRLEPPVNAEQLELLRLLLDRRVEEIEVEDRADDVPLDPRLGEVRLRDHALLQQRLGLLAVLLETRRREETALELLHLVRQLDDREAVDVARAIELLRCRQLRRLKDPVVATLEVPLLGLQSRKRLLERALQRIARILVVVHDRAAVAIQRLVMAAVDRRKPRRVPAHRTRGLLAPDQRAQRRHRTHGS